jgi:hypothetical protein
MSGTPNHPSSAISSYSGFIYQGKVALLHCLSLFAQKSIHELTGYKLQIDSLDDFAILNGSTVISLHQVKAKKTHLFSSYKDDFDKQKRKLIECKGEGAYFHVSQEITNFPSTFITDYPDTDIYVYKHVDNTENAFCKLKDINRCIEVALKDALTNLRAERYKFEESYIELNRICLEEIICTQVILIHSEIQENGISQNEAAYRKTINFTRLLDVLTENIEDKVLTNIQYWAYLLKSEYGECLNEFCVRNQSLTNDELITLNHFASHVNSLDSVKLLSFSSSIVPHKTNSLKRSSIINFKNGTFDNEDLKAGFFKLLKTLNSTDVIKSENGCRFYWSINEEKLHPTVIYRSTDDAEDVCRDILEASLASGENIFFERDKLINQYIDSDNIFTNSLDSRQRTYDLEDEYNGGLPQDKIFNFKQVSLISVQKAKELIDG